MREGREGFEERVLIPPLSILVSGYGGGGQDDEWGQLSVFQT